MKRVITAQHILETFATPNDELYNLTLTGTSGKQETMGVTGNHPFWVKDKGWTESDLLKPGDLVQAKDSGWLTVVGLALRADKATGYNLEVEGDHTYFVGDSHAWVHSGCGNLTSLQGKFEELAEQHLLPQFREVDPNLRAGYTGSFKTGTVGNPQKTTFGQPIDLSNFDLN